jgi:hypothetical protein
MAKRKRLLKTWMIRMAFYSISTAKENGMAYIAEG